MKKIIFCLLAVLLCFGNASATTNSMTVKEINAILAKRDPRIPLETALYMMEHPHEKVGIITSISREMEAVVLLPHLATIKKTRMGIYVEYDGTAYKKVGTFSEPENITNDFGSCMIVSLLFGYLILIYHSFVQQRMKKSWWNESKTDYFNRLQREKKLFFFRKRETLIPLIVIFIIFILLNGAEYHDAEYHDVGGTFSWKPSVSLLLWSVPFSGIAHLIRWWNTNRLIKKLKNELSHLPIGQSS